MDDDTYTSLISADSLTPVQRVQVSTWRDLKTLTPS